MKRKTTEPLYSERKKPSTDKQRPGFRDPRVLLGILFILLSFVAVIAITHITNPAQQYYAAKDDIHIGDKITIDMLTPVEANMGAASKNYISANDVKKGNLVASELIPSGELLSKSSARTQVNENRRLVTVSMDKTIALTLKPGEHVDVWALRAESKKLDENLDKENEQSSHTDIPPLVRGAEVSSVTVDKTPVGSNNKATVKLWVEEYQVPDIVEVSSGGAKIILVPVALKPDGQ